MTKTPKDDLLPTLRALVHDSNARSQTAMLRDIFDEVEGVLQKGVKREAVLNALNMKGFTLTMDGFKTALRRIRNEKRRNLSSVISQKKDD